MAQYIDDLQTYPVGTGLPAGWADAWAASTWSIIEEAGDRILRRATQTVTWRRAAVLTAVGSDPDSDNCEVLVRLRVNSTTQNSSAGAALRVSGSTSEGAQGYVCAIYNSSQLRVSKYIAGQATVVLLTTASGALSIAANTWYWLRFRANGSSLKGKFWAAGSAEPGAWTFEISDSDVTGVGGAGVAALGNSYVEDFAEIAIATNGDTATLYVDPTPPALTSPTGSTASSTTASGTVTTDEGNGTLYFLATTNATELASTVVASGATQAIGSTGLKTVNFTGLTPATLYYAHYVHVDAAGNVSARVSSASFTTSAVDSTPPTLSAAAGAQTGATTANLSVSTNENNGTVYVVVTTSATAPTAAQVRAGQNHSGTAAVFAGSQPVSSTGAKTFSAVGLSASTTYYAHYHHRDASNNDSTVVSSSSFTTAAVGTKGARVTLFSGVSAQANLTGLTAVWWDITTPHQFNTELPKFATNAATTDATGLLELNLAGATALAIGAKGFLLVYKLNGGDSNLSLVFAGQVAVVSIT